MTLDHLVYAVPDLVAAVDSFERRTGVRPAPGGRHVGLGSANYLIGLRAGRGVGAYLEIVGPDPDEATRPTRLPLGIEALSRPTLVTWAIGTRDIDAAVSNARTRGYDPGEPTHMSRRTATGDLLRWRLTPSMIADGGGLVPFLIDWGTTRHPTAAALPSVDLARLSLHARDPATIRRRLAALDVDVSVLDIEAATEDQLEAVVALGEGAGPARLISLI